MCDKLTYVSLKAWLCDPGLGECSTIMALCMILLFVALSQNESVIVVLPACLTWAESIHRESPGHNNEHILNLNTHIPEHALSQFPVVFLSLWIRQPGFRVANEHFNIEYARTKSDINISYTTTEAEINGFFFYSSLFGYCQFHEEVLFLKKLSEIAN